MLLLYSHKLTNPTIGLPIHLAGSCVGSIDDSRSSPNSPSAGLSQALHPMSVVAPRKHRSVRHLVESKRLIDGDTKGGMSILESRILAAWQKLP